MKYRLEEYTNKEELNPEIFLGGDIISPEARVIFLKAAQKFYEDLNIDFPIIDIILTGSSANYNWTKYSDIDIHLVIDFKNLSDIDSWRSFFSHKKKEFTDQHKIEYKGKPVELYVQDVNESHISSGVYSLLRSEWIIKPVYDKVDIDDEEIMMKAKPIMDEIDSINGSSPEQVQALKDKIKRLRQNGLENGGEYSIENLAFKELRNLGYIKKLYDTEEHEENPNDLKQLDIVKHFVNFAGEALRLSDLPHRIILSYDTNAAKKLHSFGYFSPSENNMWVYVKNRNAADIIRTIAHELIHRKQEEEGRIDSTSGDTGSEIENEANALAGVLLRNYGKKHVEIYEIMKNKEFLKKLINEAIEINNQVAQEEGYNVRNVIKKIEEDAHNASKAQQIERLQLEIDSINSKLAEEVLNETDEAERNIKTMRVSRKRLQDHIGKLRGYDPAIKNEPVDTKTPEESDNAGELEERKLTAPEKKQKEKVVKAIKKDTGADKGGEFTSKSGKTYNAFAIATAAAKKKK